MSKVSVVIPCFNRSSMLLRAVNSVLAQTFKDFELIVVDDGSSESQDEVRKLLSVCGQKYIRIPHSGVSAARNFGVEQAAGRFIAFLDSDDEFLPKKLERQVAFLQTEKFSICHTEERWIRRGKFVNPRLRHEKARGDGFLASLKLCCISPSTVMLEKSLFVSLGGFDEQMPVGEDYDLWLRLTAHHAIGFLKEPLVIKHGGDHEQLSMSKPAMDRFRIYALIKLLCSGKLSAEQSFHAMAELRQKAEVMRHGASKRGNQEVQARLSLLLQATGEFFNMPRFLSRECSWLLDDELFGSSATALRVAEQHAA